MEQSIFKSHSKWLETLESLQDQLLALRSNYIYITTEILSKPIRYLNKQIQDTIMNYFLENHVGMLLKKPMKLGNMKEVNTVISKEVENDSSNKPKYMVIMNAYVDKIKQFGLEEEYCCNLWKIFLEEEQNSLFSDEGITQIRLKTVAIILLTHFCHENRENIITIYHIWNILYPNDAIPQREMSIFGRLKKIKKSASIKGPENQIKIESSFSPEESLSEYSIVPKKTEHTKNQQIQNFSNYSYGNQKQIPINLQETENEEKNHSKDFANEVSTVSNQKQTKNNQDLKNKKMKKTKTQSQSIKRKYNKLGKNVERQENQNEYEVVQYFDDIEAQKKEILDQTIKMLSQKQQEVQSLNDSKSTSDETPIQKKIKLESTSQDFQSIQENQKDTILLENPVPQKQSFIYPKIQNFQMDQQNGQNNNNSFQYFNQQISLPQFFQNQFQMQQVPQYYFQNPYENAQFLQQIALQQKMNFVLNQSYVQQPEYSWCQQPIYQQMNMPYNYNHLQQCPNCKVDFKLVPLEKEEKVGIVQKL